MKNATELRATALRYVNPLRSGRSIRRQQLLPGSELLSAVLFMRRAWPIQLHRLLLTSSTMLLMPVRRTTALTTVT
ncbi:hypothetical protein BaRGS_00031679 [Batillaria attramentaria]|uniref:Uncharacterized protein n=1 Tax=Batillaria attramentaria TaxID=370345 RepID=A0ABD0JQG7_9CAEN